MRGDVLFVVQFPDLVLPFVRQPRVLGILHLYFQLAQLIGQPQRRFGGCVVSTAEIFLHEVRDVRIQDLCRQLRIARFEAHVEQPALRHSFYSQAAKKRAQFWRTLVIREASRSNRFRSCGRSLHLLVWNQSAVANGVQSQRLAGQDSRLRFNVVVHVRHEVVGIRALEWQNTRIVPVNLDSCCRRINRLHAEGCDGNDGYHGQQKGQDQPLMLPQN